MARPSTATNPTPRRSQPQRPPNKVQVMALDEFKFDKITKLHFKSLAMHMCLSIESQQFLATPMDSWIISVLNDDKVCLLVFSLYIKHSQWVQLDSANNTTVPFYIMLSAALSVATPALVCNIQAQVVTIEKQLLIICKDICTIPPGCVLLPNKLHF
jgi:hypothetical protein